jgi:hypothetical protein
VTAQIIGAIDMAAPGSDGTALMWWLVDGDKIIEWIPSRLHDDDLPGEMLMYPAGFLYIPGLDTMVLRSQPEVDYARSDAQFNDAFGPTARTRIAQERMNARLDRKRIRQERYRRMYSRRALN